MVFNVQVVDVANSKSVRCFNVRFCFVVALYLHVDVTAFNFEVCVAAFCFTPMSAYNELSVSSYSMFQFGVNHFQPIIVLSELAINMMLVQCMSYECDRLVCGSAVLRFVFIQRFEIIKD